MKPSASRILSRHFTTIGLSYWSFARPGGIASSKNGRGESARSRSSTSKSARCFAASKIHLAGFSLNRFARVLPTITLILSVLIAPFGHVSSSFPLLWPDGYRPRVLRDVRPLALLNARPSPRSREAPAGQACPHQCGARDITLRARLRVVRDYRSRRTATSAARGCRKEWSDRRPIQVWPTTAGRSAGRQWRRRGCTLSNQREIG